MLSCVYGSYQPESSVEDMLKNKFVRDVLERERELEFFKAQYLASSILMTINQKADVVLALNKQVQNLSFPWEKPEEEKPAASAEDAVKRYQEMQKSGTIDGVRRDVSVDEVFQKWHDPLQDEEPK